MHKSKLKDYFYDHGITISFINIKDVSLKLVEYQNKSMIYTSSEAPDYLYGSYFEDIVYGLEILGANIILVKAGI